MLYRKTNPKKTGLKRDTRNVGIRLEDEVVRMTRDKEPIGEGVELKYTERSEGILPEYDIRTNSIELAMEALDLDARNYIAKKNGITKADVIKNDDNIDDNTPDNNNDDTNPDRTGGDTGEIGD